MIRVRTWAAAMVAPWIAGCFAADPSESRVAKDDAEVARAADMGAGPATAPPPVDAARPDAAIADAAKPDAATPDAATPDAAKPDAVRPDAATPDAMRPDLNVTDAAALPDAALPDAVLPDAAAPADASPLDWTCPPLDCERDIPDAPEGAPMVCDEMDFSLECDISMPTCDLGDCQNCDLECVPGFMAGSPGDRLEGCFDCPITEIISVMGGESAFFCDGDGGARRLASPFHWCRFDDQGRVVEKEQRESRFGVTYRYDAQGRIVSARASWVEDSGHPMEGGHTCRYDDAGRVIARTSYHFEYDDAIVSDDLSECVRYDAAGRVLGYERSSFRLGAVFADRCTLSAEPDACAACESPDYGEAGAACADELAGMFPF